MIGHLTSNLGDLPLPDSHYYYSPNSIANILLPAILSKTHCIYMDTNLDNAFYVFDEKGRYLRFYNCPITNIYRLEPSRGGCCGLKSKNSLRYSLRVWWVDSMSTRVSTIGTSR